MAEHVQFLNGFLNMWYLGKKLIVVGCVVCGLVFIGDLPGTVALGQAAVEETEELERKQIVDNLVGPFIRALQTGDVQGIEGHIGGNLEKILGRLLRQNKDYPDFLREKYGGTSLRGPIKIFQPINISGLQSNESKKKIAVVPMNSPKGQKDIILEMEKNSKDLWMIVDQKVTE